MTAGITAAQVHGSAVAFDCGAEWAGVLILGKPGAGKSELALELMAMGARLVADDQTCLERSGAQVHLTAPATIRDMIELRGLGILRAPALGSARLAVIVDLDALETRRLPEPARADVHGVPVMRLRKCPSRAFAAGLRQVILSRCWDTETQTLP